MRCKRKGEKMAANKVICKALCRQLIDTHYKMEGRYPFFFLCDVICENRVLCCCDGYVDSLFCVCMFLSVLRECEGKKKNVGALLV